MKKWIPPGMDLLVDVGDKQEAITELSFEIKGKKIIGLT